MSLFAAQLNHEAEFPRSTLNLAAGTLWRVTAATFKVERGNADQADILDHLARITYLVHKGVNSLSAQPLHRGLRLAAAKAGQDDPQNPITPVY